MNIANHGPEHLSQLCHSKLLPAFLDLIKSQDADMIRLGLGYIELLLTQLPNVTYQVNSLLYVYANACCV